MYPVASLFGTVARTAPVFVRVVFGAMMTAHGWDKIQGDPTAFGEFLGSELGLPAGVALGWLVTLLEFGGGLMLIVGFLSRPVAFLMAVELIGAIYFVTWSNGLIGEEGVGFERDLAYISGFLVVMLLGPGRPSVDHVIGLEESVPAAVPATAGFPSRTPPARLSDGGPGMRETRGPSKAGARRAPSVDTPSSHRR
jgi:putative oxidoreductase